MRCWTCGYKCATPTYLQKTDSVITCINAIYFPLSCLCFCRLSYKWDLSVQNNTLSGQPVPFSHPKMYHMRYKCREIHVGVNISAEKYWQLASLHSDCGDADLTSRSRSQTNMSFKWHFVKSWIFLQQKSTENQLLPQDVESLCPDSAMTYLHSIAGRGYYLILLPDSQVDAEAQFASGVMQPWQWTHKSIRPFVCFCLSNWTPQRGLQPVFRALPLRSLWSIVVPRIIEITVQWV